MRTRQTFASHGASLATALLALALLVGVTAHSAAAYLEVLSTLGATVAVLSAVKLHRDNCFESRFGAVLVAVAAFVGTVLAAVVGLPGSEQRGTSGLGLVTLLLAGAIPGLVSLDARLRARSRAVAGPYAS